MHLLELVDSVLRTVRIISLMPTHTYIYSRSPSLGIVAIWYLWFGFHDPSTVCNVGQRVKCGLNTTVPASFSYETVPWWLPPSPNSMGSMKRQTAPEERWNTDKKRHSQMYLDICALSSTQYETDDKCSVHTWTLPRTQRQMWVGCAQTCLDHSMANLAVSLNALLTIKQGWCFH